MNRNQRKEKSAVPTLYYFQIHLRHLLAPFPFWRPVVPFSVALLRCIPLPLARMKNSRRILAHSHLEIVLTNCGAALYYFQIHLHHLLAPFPFWRPLIPLSVALLRCVSFTLARMKNSRRILVHFYLEI